MGNCFQPDATIHIAWMSSPATEFVERSAGMLAEYKDGEHAKHVIGSGRVQLNGARAYAQCHVNLVTRVFVDDILFDWEFRSQFHDLVEKRANGAWRFFRRTMVYEKDRLDPVHPGLQHVGFELGNIDEVAAAGQRMVEKGYINCWGPGRHAPGSNYFHYLRDPWNYIVEYFRDMDYISAGADWPARVWKNEDADAVWAPHLPDDFLTNFEALGR